MKLKRLCCRISALCAIMVWGCQKSPDNTGEPPQVVLQLNWLHDPTFSGEYLLAKKWGSHFVIREGGPNILPTSEVLQGRAQFAIVGADIYLEACEEGLRAKQPLQLACLFVDFQRNPVGWVLHPEVAKQENLATDVASDPHRLNAWLFDRLRDGKIQMGDKRGTETTAIWVQWKRVHNLPENVAVIPVGFDPSIVLSKPRLAYPVYLNEEPFKLSDKIGQPVVIFDPVADGVSLYGNVVICRKDCTEKNADLVKKLQDGLRDAWMEAKKDPRGAAAIVTEVYKGVPLAVVEKQVNKTLEFVFFGTDSPGSMTEQRWNETVLALQQAGMVGTELTTQKISPYLLSAK